MPKVRFILYERSYCHLCHDMFVLLEKLCNQISEDAGSGHEWIERVDIDADFALIAQYDELVPVLIGQKEGQSPIQLCHYFLDVEKIQAFLQD